MTIRTITKPISKGWDFTRGYKTVIATVVWLILRAIDLIFPGFLTLEVQTLILDVASFIGVLGIGDKLWRYFEEKFKKKK